MQSKKDDNNIVNMGKSPLLSTVTCKRDSGYGTDVNSPASHSSGTSVPRRFTFGSYDTDVDLDFSENLEEMNLDDNEEVFTGCEVNQETPLCQAGADDDDKEVEELFNESIEIQHSVSEPINIQRPQAPVPTPEDIDNDSTWVPLQRAEESDVSRPYYNTSWTKHDRARHRFRPIASRSFGTQTPSPQNQDRNGLRPCTKGKRLSRLRLRSESECVDFERCSPLPDVVPQGRDRSVSLPNVPCFRQVQEQAVGRELRRISDEFHSSFTPVRRRDSLPQQPSSFPRRVNIDIQACWSRIRRIVSTSSFEQGQGDSPTFDSEHFN